LDKPGDQVSAMIRCSVDEAQIICRVGAWSNPDRAWGPGILRNVWRWNLSVPRRACGRPETPANSSAMRRGEVAERLKAAVC